MSETNSNLLPSIPIILALSGAYLVPTSELTVETLEIPDTPSAMHQFYGDEDTLSIASFNIQFLGSV